MTMSQVTMEVNTKGQAGERSFFGTRNAPLCVGTGAFRENVCRPVFGGFSMSKGAASKLSGPSADGLGAQGGAGGSRFWR